MCDSTFSCNTWFDVPKMSWNCPEILKFSCPEKSKVAVLRPASTSTSTDPVPSTSVSAGVVQTPVPSTSASTDPVPSTSTLLVHASRAQCEPHPGLEEARRILNELSPRPKLQSSRPHTRKAESAVILTSSPYKALLHEKSSKLTSRNGPAKRSRAESGKTWCSPVCALWANMFDTIIYLVLFMKNMFWMYYLLVRFISQIC